MPNQEPLRSTAAGTYAYSRLFDAFADYVCPRTGTLDLARGAQTIDPVHHSLRELGIPDDHTKVLAAYALLDVIDMKKQFAGLTPEHFSV